MPKKKLTKSSKNKENKKNKELKDIGEIKEIKKDLETTLKEKVEPLLEKTIEKHIGIAIPQLETDITDKLKHPSTEVYIPFDLPFTQAKKFFKKEFFKKELQTHQGNISQLAKFLDLDRRSIHRTIKNLGIKIKNLRAIPILPSQHREKYIGETIRSTLEQYEEIIRPQKMEQIYGQVKSLSKNIAKHLPSESLTWKQAEREFEKQFLKNALEEQNWRIADTAKKIKLRSETLSRKIKKFGLRK